MLSYEEAMKMIKEANDYEFYDDGLLEIRGWCDSVEETPEEYVLLDLSRLTEEMLDVLQKRWIGEEE